MTITLKIESTRKEIPEALFSAYSRLTPAERDQALALANSGYRGPLSNFMGEVDAWTARDRLRDAL